MRMKNTNLESDCGCHVTEILTLTATRNLQTADTEKNSLSIQTFSTSKIHEQFQSDITSAPLHLYPWHRSGL